MTISISESDEWIDYETPSSESKRSAGWAGPSSGWEADAEESNFEMFENGENLDATAINSMTKDECQSNPEECAKYVEKMRREGKLHIGAITIDEDGNPVADVPKAMIFDEELRLTNGGDTEK